MRILTTAAVAITAVTVPAAPATADPALPPVQPVQAPPAVEPGPAVPPFIPEPVGIGNPLAQSGQPTGPLGLPDLSAYGSNLLLGQSAVPAPPGGPGPAVIPNLNAFNPEYLLGQNLAPAAPGDGSPAPGLGPDQDIPGTGRIAFLHRLYEMYQAGALKGSLLGQQSPEEFAQQAAAAAATPPG